MAESCNRQGGPALEAMYRFMLWLIPAVEKFPRTQKFLLGDRIQNAALDVLERMIEATYTRQRDALLGQANTSIEKLRFFAQHGVVVVGNRVRAAHNTADYLPERKCMMQVWSLRRLGGRRKRYATCRC